MELAVIVPPGAEELVPDEYLMMAFADIAFENPEYARFYAQRERVIMDNQIYEGQTGLPSRELAFILGFVRPTVAIVPDVRGSGIRTVARARQYLPLLREVRKQGIELCGVVQGSDANDMEVCAQFFVRESQIDWMAYPIKPAYGPARANVFSYVRFKAETAGKPVHFLGMEQYTPFFNDPRPDKWDLVRSLDTAEPTVATIYGVTLESLQLYSYADAQAHPLLKRPPDFMTWPGYVEILKARKELLWRNLAWMQSLLKTPSTSLQAPDVTQPESADEGTQPTE